MDSVPLFLMPTRCSDSRYYSLATQYLFSCWVVFICTQLETRGPFVLAPLLCYKDDTYNFVVNKCLRVNSLAT